MLAVIVAYLGGIGPCPFGKKISFGHRKKIGKHGLPPFVTNGLRKLTPLYEILNTPLVCKLNCCCKLSKADPPSPILALFQRGSTTARGGSNPLHFYPVTTS